MHKSTRREYQMVRIYPDAAEAILQADLARIALRREFEGWSVETAQDRLLRAS